jgi:hypothetical protein
MNAFTSKPDVSEFVKKTSKDYRTSKSASIAARTNKQRTAFVINPDNPRNNPLATEQEKLAWQQKQLVRRTR